ncbi:isomerase glucose-6-phosphate isomerase [Phaeodactylum tricornutum CCAP 1055/1]|jgi:glucose-6-phosphate isomerase|uniref:Glucose-6-phosphate isomerase n=2 Tax=Phaeodactylum tricornutum TaxID=2850 RepID=B7GDV0_PHATC|nr:isomerase glucose-6-phosphate isomerase [Phaeodactylum tricornutum CCAP 1055/1]EEC43144.1 isomerase glucose-6-phosphate isomerase [Phaeodactylum tricornutum CCAP 1055/1]|eukprot:XP_002185275.1 isomerase glucose-6-phosphate isomerase [Phaeodactylum tricornutum CCAP 1055/1]
MRAILESHCFHVFSILLLLLCSFSSAFVPLSLPMRTPRAVRLQVMTEPPRGGTSRTEAKEDKDDDPKALSPESDYLLQTEDFTRQWKKPEQHSLEVPRVRHTVLSERDYHRLEAIIFQDDATEGSEEATVLQRRVSLPNIPIPPRLARPGVAWQHHHHATVNLVRQHRNQKHDGPIQFITNIINRPQLVSTCSEWKRLEKHAEYIGTTHLKDLLQDRERCDEMYATHDGVYLDYSRQRVTLETMKFLYALAEKQNLKGQIDKMVKGDKINFTEDRAVLHTALRAERALTGTVMVDGVDVIAEVHQVLDQVKVFTDGVRSGQIRGYTGKRLRNIVSVGIGGSYLGPEFLHECLKTEPEGINSALGYSLRFLSNVDPVDVERTCADLDPEETLVVVVSKTFTTAETMLNARTMRQWLWDFMGNDKEVVKKHMVACASVSAIDNVRKFGIDTDRYFFRFWDFVGGRYSVCSAAGAVPISLLYGFDLFEKFLQGANSMDKHFLTAPYDRNIPVLMGLLGVWNMSFMNYKARTTLPYAEALLKLPAHIQQLDMESNGKTMTKHGLEVDYPVGEIDFGEAGTNGQHSFYQLLHMGQTVPCDFIGFVQSQHDFCLDGENLSSHDELMANFFAQPDALATGKTADEVRAEGVPPGLVGHKVFKGNRPSLSLLLPKLTAYACGQLLAIYEHRTAVQGFMWDINSFDQWGVELGKKLAIDVKGHLLNARRSEEEVETSNPATTRLLNYYVNNSRRICQEAPYNPITSVTRKTHREHASAPLPPLPHDLGGQEGRLT